MRGGSRTASGRRAVIALALPVLLAAPARGEAAGARLAERVEARLAQEEARLRESLGHYGLGHPVEQDELHAFMRPVHRVATEPELLLGTDAGLELHGGGILSLLAQHEPDLARAWTNRRGQLLSAEQRREFAPADASLVLGHEAGSFGRLLADARVGWSPAERAQAKGWLRWLEAHHFRDLAAAEPQPLAHLLLGLRRAREHGGRLE